MSPDYHLHPPLNLLLFLSYDVTLVSRRIAELHGGQVSLKSSEDEYGALLTFELPLLSTSSRTVHNDDRRIADTRLKGTEDVIVPSASKSLLDPLSLIRKCQGTVHVTDHHHLSAQKQSEATTGPRLMGRKRLSLIHSDMRFRSVGWESPVRVDDSCIESDDVDVCPPPSSSATVTPTGSFTNNVSYPPRLRCLIVDDVAVCRKMLCRVMSVRFESVEEATDGLDALHKVKASIHQDTPFDVILMDFQMPIMDGPTATREIRGCGFHGILIGVTGNVLPEDLQIFLDSGINYVFTKPLDLEHFDRIFNMIFQSQL